MIQALPQKTSSKQFAPKMQNQAPSSFKESSKHPGINRARFFAVKR
jgi:hypothetical protein